MENSQQFDFSDDKARRYATELGIIFFLTVLVYFISARYDIFEHIYRFSRTHEAYELDEVLSIFIFLVFSMSFFAICRWMEVNRTLGELIKKHGELEKAFAEIKQLRGIIPICSSCKKIRDDEGYWHMVEEYIQNHSDAQFSHGICPECFEKVYPELMKMKAE
ncbi:MAG: hypothetical protein HY788_18895 [Deltaproteobacteria bacterium]|nr:hypothetical protein [Deltaproteobacteria bacterium]